MSLMLLSLAGCTVMHPGEPEKIQVPETFTASQTLENVEPVDPNLTWRGVFADTAFARLLTIASEQSFDIQTAREKLIQLEAKAQQAFAARLPSVTAPGGVKSTLTRTDTGSQAVHKHSKTYEVGAKASWELDLWGRVAALSKAADLRVQAAGDDVEAAKLSVIATLADSWAQYVSLKDEQSVVLEQIQTNESMFNVRRVMYENGQAAAIDLIEQKKTWVSAQAKLPAIRSSLVNLQDQICVLVGRMPGDREVLSLLENSVMPEVKTTPQSGVPAQLLEQRADLRSAWKELQARGWDTAAARAERFPQITLSASFIFDAANPGILFQNWTRLLSGTFSGTLFDGGSKQSAVDSAQSLQRSALISYTKSVASAIADTSAAIANDVQTQRESQLIKEQLELAVIAHDQAYRGWLNGVSSFSRYITALETRQTLERSAASSRGDVLRARIKLMRTIALPVDTAAQ